MRVEILGSAAGGGFPQWNCNCRNCHSLRAGKFHGKARTQNQVAVSAQENIWFLLNASPDLRLQIEASSFLYPQNLDRDSPIRGVVLTSADVDLVAGLLSLRELQPLRIYCTQALAHILREDNSIFSMLNRIPNQVVWNEFELCKRIPLMNVDGMDGGICAMPFSLGTRYPAYVSPARGANLPPTEASVGLSLASESGRELVYLPAVPSINDSVLEWLKSADVVLFDGTFWSDDELIRVQGSGSTARDMGHVPVGGEDGSLRRLVNLRAPKKIFIHINNTNPMLDENGPEYRQIRDAGWELAEDGMAFDV